MQTDPAGKPTSPWGINTSRLRHRVATRSRQLYRLDHSRTILLQELHHDSKNREILWFDTAVFPRLKTVRIAGLNQHERVMMCSQTQAKERLLPSALFSEVGDYVHEAKENCSHLRHANGPQIQLVAHYYLFADFYNLVLPIASSQEEIWWYEDGLLRKCPPAFRMRIVSNPSLHPFHQVRALCDGSSLRTSKLQMLAFDLLTEEIIEGYIPALQAAYQHMHDVVLPAVDAGKVGNMTRHDALEVAQKIAAARYRPALVLDQDTSWPPLDYTYDRHSDDKCGDMDVETLTPDSEDPFLSKNFVERLMTGLV